MNLRASQSAESGFSLIETMIAIIVLMVGVLGLAAMLANGLTYMTTSQYQYIAQQKAAEAVESIFSARDVGQATWGQICNTGSSICTSGIFVTGFLPLCGPGNDGILGTADDYLSGSCAGSAANAAPDAILLPNNTSGVFGANGVNDVTVPLSTYTRQIAITNVLNAAGVAIPNLRQITVTINYSAGNFKNLNYTLNTYISSVP